MHFCRCGSPSELLHLSKSAVKKKLQTVWVPIFTISHALRLQILLLQLYLARNADPIVRGQFGHCGVGLNLAGRLQGGGLDWASPRYIPRAVVPSNDGNSDHNNKYGLNDFIYDIVKDVHRFIDALEAGFAILNFKFCHHCGPGIYLHYCLQDFNDHLCCPFTQ